MRRKAGLSMSGVHAACLAAAGLLAVLVTSGIALRSVAAEAVEICAPAPIRHAAAPERIIAIDTPDGRIAGTLAGPADTAPEALALMLHGYTGARNEIPVAGGEGMFARTARALAERGVATLRIDFIGSGRSDGDWADTRFSTQARDALRAATALRAEYAEVKDAADLPLGVLGYSQGGLVALRAAASGGSGGPSGGGPFDRLALWNPVMDPMATYAVIFGRETILQGARRHDDGSADIVPETRLRPGFFAEIVAADPIADAAATTAAVLVVTGRRDPLVMDGAALASRMQAGRSAETRILDLDAGHDLGALREPALLDSVIACTAGFLLGDKDR
ncbi:MAG: alpha/beta fold hydrolase [Pseudomonadota bacterium]